MKILFEVGAIYPTRGGYAARVICNDRKGDYSIVALVTIKDCEDVELYRADGEYFHCAPSGPMDLLTERIG